MALHFVYSALVYVYGGDETPEVVQHTDLTDSLTCSLSDIDAHGEIEDQFETKSLEPGMYNVWIVGHVTFSTYETQDGTEHDQSVYLDTQYWNKLSEEELKYALPPDVEPVTIFYSKSPVPEPNWERFAVGRPFRAPEDSPPTHNFWRRKDDDGRTIYQCSGTADKIPTLMDGAYYAYDVLALVKGLDVLLMIEGPQND